MSACLPPAKGQMLATLTQRGGAEFYSKDDDQTVLFGDDVLAYRVPEVAEKLRVSESKIWKMIASGEIEARKIGSATVVRAEDLKAYLAGIPIRDSTAKPATEGQGTP